MHVQMEVGMIGIKGGCNDILEDWLMTDEKPQSIEMPVNFMVPRRRIELRTQGFSGLCSTY